MFICHCFYLQQFSVPGILLAPCQEDINFKKFKNNLSTYDVIWTIIKYVNVWSSVLPSPPPLFTALKFYFSLVWVFFVENLKVKR